MSSPCVLPVTTISPDMPGFADARGPVQRSRQDLQDQFTPGQVAAMGYPLFDISAGGTGSPVHPGAPRELLPNLHSMLEGAMQARDVAAACAVLETGLRTDLDLMNFGYDPAGEEPPEVSDISAMALAVLLDSEAGELVFLPLLAQHGNLLQVDSHGRTLMAYATHPGVIVFLLDANVIVDAVSTDGIPMKEHWNDAVTAMIERAVLERTVPAADAKGAALRL